MFNSSNLEVVRLTHAVIDAHIHLDMYEAADRARILDDLEMYNIEALISVSNHLASAHKNLELSKTYPAIKPAFGFHPEQHLPPTEELTAILSFINNHHHHMVAIGEVGLPYYLRRDNPSIPIEPYIEWLEVFIKQARTLNKPVILHAIFEDAPVVCDLLEKHSLHQVHFHWFKGDDRTIERLINNGYYISITPDVVYEEEIQQIVHMYPLSLMMVETDGPWPFKGPYKNDLTHPKMIHHTIKKIAQIKRQNEMDVYRLLYENTRNFYNLN